MTKRDNHHQRLTDIKAKVTEPPKIVTVIELSEVQEKPVVGALWPGRHPRNDEVTVAVSDTLIVKGTPFQIKEWAADVALVAAEAERDMLEERVVEGRGRRGIEL